MLGRSSTRPICIPTSSRGRIAREADSRNPLRGALTPPDSEFGDDTASAAKAEEQRRRASVLATIPLAQPGEGAAPTSCAGDDAAGDEQLIRAAIAAATGAGDTDVPIGAVVFGRTAPNWPAAKRPREVLGDLTAR